MTKVLIGFVLGFFAAIVVLKVFENGAGSIQVVDGVLSIDLAEAFGPIAVLFGILVVIGILVGGILYALRPMKTESDQ